MVKKFANNSNAKPVILITLPKSGSMYLYHTLRMTYGLATSQHFGGEFPNIEFSRNLVSELTNQHQFISQTHASASHHNLVVLDHFFDRAVVHVRDPRQALLSWVHSTETLLKGSPLDQAIFGLDDSYYALPLEKRIACEIKRFFPGIIRWLQGWKAALEQDRKCRFLLTRFEDMVDAPPATAQKIANFFQLPEADLLHPDQRTAHFREGYIDEWRRVFTPMQIQRVNSMIPADIMAYFGWEEETILPELASR